MAEETKINHPLQSVVKKAANALAFGGETFLALLHLLIRPRDFRMKDAALSFQRSSFEGLGVTTGIGFLLGLILAFESAAALQMFGAEVYVADLLAIGLFRELGPLVTAIVLAGRSGSAFAAEIASMKANEELDALVTMGLKPVRFLVLPRISAAVLAMPILTIFAELAGLLGGAIVLRAMNVPVSVFAEHLRNTSDMFMILYGLSKSMLFGLLIALISCASGINAKADADGVGTASTGAVVGSIVAIAVADGLLALLCNILGV